MTRKTAKKTVKPAALAPAKKVAAAKDELDTLAVSEALCDPAFVASLGLRNGDDESTIIERARAALGL